VIGYNEIEVLKFCMRNNLGIDPLLFQANLHLWCYPNIPTLFSRWARRENLQWPNRRATPQGHRKGSDSVSLYFH